LVSRKQIGFCINLAKYTSPQQAPLPKRRYRIGPCEQANIGLRLQKAACQPQPNRPGSINQNFHNDKDYMSVVVKEHTKKYLNHVCIKRRNIL
jgi:hypothetical protein